MTENQGGAPSVTKVVSVPKGAAKGKPLSIAEAARRLGVPPQTIYDWLHQGKLRPASLTFGSGQEGQAAQAMVFPVDPELAERWHGGASGSNVDRVAPAAAAEGAARDVPTPPPVVEFRNERLESEVAFLKGRIAELEKALAWERDARLKVEGEISILKQDKARLEGQIALSAKVEKSLQKYTDRLEQDLKEARAKK